MFGGRLRSMVFSIAWTSHQKMQPPMQEISNGTNQTASIFMAQQALIQYRIWPSYFHGGLLVKSCSVSLRSQQKNTACSFLIPFGSAFTCKGGIHAPPQREISRVRYAPQKWNISFRVPPPTPSPPNGVVICTYCTLYTCTIHPDYVIMWTNAAHMLSTLRHAEINLPTYWTAWCSQYGIVSNYTVTTKKALDYIPCLPTFTIQINHMWIYHFSRILWVLLTNIYITFILLRILYRNISPAANWGLFLGEIFQPSTEVKVANRVWCLPPGLGVVPGWPVYPGWDPGETRNWEWFHGT